MSIKYFFGFPYIFPFYASLLFTLLRFDLKFTQAETSNRNSDDLKETFWSNKLKIAR